MPYRQTQGARSRKPAQAWRCRSSRRPTYQGIKTIGTQVNQHCRSSGHPGRVSATEQDPFPAKHSRRVWRGRAHDCVWPLRGLPRSQISSGPTRHCIRRIRCGTRCDCRQGEHGWHESWRQEHQGDIPTPITSLVVCKFEHAIVLSWRFISMQEARQSSCSRS